VLQELSCRSYFVETNPGLRKYANMNLNLSASLNVFKLISRPSLCLPHHTVPTFNDLPIPLNKAFEGSGKEVDIRAVVLDKDDCFAFPEANEVYKPYKVRNKKKKKERKTLAIDPSLL
jgi:hypothetical protein